LKDGKLADEDLSEDGSSLLQNLSKFENANFNEKIEKKNVFNDVLKEIDDPSQVCQGSRSTCGGTCAQIKLVKDYPSEYARLVLGLCTDEAKESNPQETENVGFTTCNGQEIKRNEGCLESDNSGRTTVDRIVQSSLMEQGNGDIYKYDNQTDKSGWYNQGVHVNGFDFTGLRKYEMKSLMDSLFPYTSTIVGSEEKYNDAGNTDPLKSNEEIDGYLKNLSENDDSAIAAIRFGATDANMHWVMVTGADDNYVYFNNPWGYTDKGETFSKNNEIYKDLPDRYVNTDGSECMTKDVFYDVFRYMVIPEEDVA
jgi:hypothetical protein